MAITESELVIPALIHLAQRDEGVATTELMSELRNVLKPSGDDVRQLSNRADDHFSQKVRNLKSHDTLERLGLATYKDGQYHITPKGRSFATEHGDKHRFLRRHGFTDKQRKRIRAGDLQDIIVEEGVVEPSSATSRKRSAALRRYAIEHFTEDGSLKCAACGFDFAEAYGDLGEGFIEIHHLEPVAALDSTGTRRSVREALKKVAPLCANCHRMVHRRDPMLELAELARIVASSRERS